jgi:hypothetical protein
VPRVDAYVLAGAGHDLNQVPNAGDYFAATQAWIADVMP